MKRLALTPSILQMFTGTSFNPHQTLQMTPRLKTWLASHTSRMRLTPSYAWSVQTRSDLAPPAIWGMIRSFDFEYRCAQMITASFDDFEPPTREGLCKDSYGFMQGALKDDCMLGRHTQVRNGCHGGVESQQMCMDLAKTARWGKMCHGAAVICTLSGYVRLCQATVLTHDMWHPAWLRSVLLHIPAKAALS